MQTPSNKNNDLKQKKKHHKLQSIKLKKKSRHKIKYKHAYMNEKKIYKKSELHLHVFIASKLVHKCSAKGFTFSEHVESMVANLAQFLGFPC